MRPIDGDALMDVINCNCYPVQHDMTSIEPGMTCVGILQAIQEQPTIEPEPRWISCEDRLPDAPLRKTGNEEDFEWFESEQVLICDRYGLIHVANLVKDYIFNEIYWSATDDDELRGEEVKAWMPLPAPYKEGADD